MEHIFAVLIICVGVTLTSGCLAKPTTASLDISGSWQFELGEAAKKDTFAPSASILVIPKQFSDTIALPGTTDTNKKGTKTTGSTKGTYTRRYKHIGRAWYQRTINIPVDWEQEELELFIERVLWKSTIYIDGVKKGDYDSLAAPHIYNLGKITPGEHTLTVCIDNSMIYNIGDKGHSYSENMQTIWNGMLGQMYIKPLPTVSIKAVRRAIHPTDKNEDVMLVVIENRSQDTITCTIDTECSKNNTKIYSTSPKIPIPPGILKFQFPASEMERWNEFEPNLYETKITVKSDKGTDTWQGKLGYCVPGSDGTHITINGQPTFLRGNLDNCHFPLTGHPPMDKDGWLRVWNIYKQFGLNRVRFHSWCPPEAAFAAADEVGIYLQPEAGVWIDGWMKSRVKSKPNGISDNNKPVRDFVGQEMKRIIDAYGHHPSFVMFCIGNELGSSDFNVLGKLIEETREYDGNVRLYSCSTARTLQPEIDDYFVSHRNPAGGMRGLRGAKTNWDYDGVKHGAPKTPMILHELGQWPVYPDWSEIDKYTGVVDARNFKNFQGSATKKHLEKHSKWFQEATGEFSVRLYKAEMEGALRSKTYAGFDLLGLQDYMGQGEATIGILDMFYDLKGDFITPVEYRKFCSPVVPLARFSKYIWLSGESLKAQIQVSNFSAKNINSSLNWKLTYNQEVIEQGTFENAEIFQGTLTDIGEIRINLKTDIPLACKLIVEIPDTDYANSWPIWIYPAKASTDTPDTIKVVDSIDKATLQNLEAGGTVLLMTADSINKSNARKNGFMPVYWSQGWFPGQKKTLGLVCSPIHPLFKYFPNEGFCDWQWKDIIDNSQSIVLDDLPPDYLPIVQPIDDFHTNYKLGTILETKVGKGKLLICSYSLRKRLKSPACRQLYSALLSYASSDEFKPASELPIEWIKNNFIPLKKINTSNQNPVSSGSAALWIQLGNNANKSKQNIPYKPALDLVKSQTEGYSYNIKPDGVWKDQGGCVAFGKTINLTINLPKGVEGTLHVRFNDWNQNGRSGKLIFENRDHTLGDHIGSNGVWVKFKTMREDALDEELKLKTTVTSGPNLQIDEFIFIPE